MEARQGTDGRLQMRWMSINGLAVRTARRTSASGGMPLVIFNGIGAALEMLLPFIDAVPDLDVITFDAPGAGRSAAPSSVPRSTSSSGSSHSYGTRDLR